MNFLMNKYANLRTFDAANEGTTGADATKAAADAATAAEAAAATKAVDDAKVASEAAAAAAALSSDPKLQAAATEKAELLREVMDKKDKLKIATKDLADARKLNEAYEGVDPAKVKELLKKEADAERIAAEAKGDFERVKTMMNTEHDKALKVVQDQLDVERDGRKADLSLIDELTVGNSFGNSEFIRDSLTISPAKARRLYGDHFERQGNTVVGYDKPAGEKDRTLLVSAKGDALSFEEALNRIVEADPDKKGVLKSKAKAGAASASDQDKGDKNKAPKVVGTARIAANLAGLGE